MFTRRSSAAMLTNGAVDDLEGTEARARKCIYGRRTRVMKTNRTTCREGLLLSEHCARVFSSTRRILASRVFLCIIVGPW